MSDTKTIIEKIIRPSDNDTNKGHQPSGNEGHQPGNGKAGHNPGGSNQAGGTKPPSTGSGKTSSTDKK